MGVLSSNLWLQSLSLCCSWRDASSSSALLIVEQTSLSDDFLFKGTWNLCHRPILFLALSSYGIHTFVRHPLSEFSFLVPVALADNT